jgi:glycerol-3-phosphate cytidylyltransferase
MGKQKQTIVYTGGTFDLFHAGHVNFLRQCKKIGKVIIALNTDEFIKEFKGKSPIMTYQERHDVLLSCRYVDEVIKNISGADSKPSIISVMPDFIIVGDDWAKKDYYKQMQFTQEWLDKLNITLAYIPYTRGISTTEVKKRLNT